MKYPADIISHETGAYGRIHLGHNLDREYLLKDLIDANIDSAPAGGLFVSEVFFRYVPRVMWCEYLGGCDQEGEWHSHWCPATPNAKHAMTIASWVHGFTGERVA